MFGFKVSYETLLANAEQARAKRDGQKCYDQYAAAITASPDRVQYTCWHYAFNPAKAFHMHWVIFGQVLEELDPSSLPGQVLCFESEIVRKKLQPAKQREAAIRALILAPFTNLLFGKSDWVIKYHHNRIQLIYACAEDPGTSYTDGMRSVMDVPSIKEEMIELSRVKSFMAEMHSADSVLVLMNYARDLHLPGDWNLLSSIHTALKNQPHAIPFPC